MQIKYREDGNKAQIVSFEDKIWYFGFKREVVKVLLSIPDIKYSNLVGYKLEEDVKALIPEVSKIYGICND